MPSELLGELKATKAQVLDRQVFIDSVMRSFTTDTGFLHSAEGGNLIGNDSFIDTDHAVFELLGNSPDAADIARVEIRSKAIAGIVGHLHGFVISLEPE